MVARETSVPDALSQMGIPVDPQGVSRLEELVQILESEGISQGLLGPNEAERVLSRHVLESCALLPLINEVSHGLIDIGSGGGLPGIPLACLGVRPVTLVESQERRARFLSTTVERLGMDPTILHARAEDAARGPLRESAGTVVARALAALPVALELTLPFAAVGGQVLLPATPELGPNGDPVVPEAIERVASELGGGQPTWVGLAVPGSLESRWVLIVPKVLATAERFPRRAGVPKRRPLG